MTEMSSTYAKLMIDDLLNVHALTSMHRSSGVAEYRMSAAGWLPSLKQLLNSLEHELTKEDAS